MSQWIQVDIYTSSQGIEPVAAVLLEMGLSYAVQDSKDFRSFLTGRDSRWDYIDEKLMELKDAPTIVTVYLANNEQGVAQLAEITRELDRLKFLSDNGNWGDLTYTLQGIAEEQWETSWKQYYNPLKISPRLTIVPVWIKYDREPDETIMLMDPGMTFGTGTHETTKLCLEFLSDTIYGGEKVLDIGTGSGILSIVAALLGADRVTAIDIDQVAVETAGKNAKMNDVENKIEFIQGDLADKVNGKYNVIVANIVANAIIKLAPDIPSLLEKDGIFVASGIIDDRADETIKAIENSGLKVTSVKEDNGWVAVYSQIKD